MLSFTFRRVLSRPGIFSTAKRLPTRAISSNRSFAITVQRNFTTTASDRNSDSTADSKPETESKPKSTRRKTGSSPKTAGKEKKVVKKKAVKKKAVKKKAVKKKVVKKPKVTISLKDKPPKGPGGAYIVWLRHWISTEPKPENPEAAQNAVKRGSQIWKALPEHEKQQYREKARTLLDEHHRRMDEWRENVDLAVLREMNRRRVAKGHRRVRGPPRPANGYVRFLKRLQVEHPLEMTEESPGSYFKAMVARARSQWWALSHAERAEYNDLARADIAAWYKAKNQAKA